ncbi:hypothetical protein G6F38_008994 [Rhizopus arrhizus]|nr:hypothetical protein G6F38_008994 [Rhizopus arrhizus]
MPKRYNRQPSTIIEDEQEDVEDDELLSTDEEQTVRSERDAEPQKRKRIAQNNGTESELLNQSNSQVDESTINALREQLRSTINQIYYLKGTMNELVVEVTHLKQIVLDLKSTVEKELQHSKEQKISSPSSQLTSITRESEGPGESQIPAKFVSIQGPFPKYTQRDRILPRPSAKQVAETLGGKEHSLQFTSHLYVDLIEKVLGPQEENLHLDYKAMVKEAIMITKAVVSHMKEAYRIDPELRWSYIDPTYVLNIGERTYSLATFG